MPIILGDTLSLNASKPSLDHRWGPYNSIQEAFNFLDDRDVLCVGLTVGVKDASTGKIDEYWFREKAQSVEDLVKKNDDDNIISILTNMSSTLTDMSSTLSKIDQRLYEQEQENEWVEC